MSEGLKRKAPLAMEANGFIRLDADSVEYVARRLLTMVAAVRKGRQPGRTSTASSLG